MAAKRKPHILIVCKDDESIEEFHIDETQWELINDGSVLYVTDEGVRHYFPLTSLVKWEAHPEKAASPHA